ncbi:hypothetical protein D1BOALGB6SA_4183 [Olavius sp. associated proteobacterium Delta 1]|nr:hypothetical protein D1BOALGB6SA_4183 [Olavius sp. associated proteobacterium Delta 1]
MKNIFKSSLNQFRVMVNDVQKKAIVTLPKKNLIFRLTIFVDRDFYRL